MSGCKLPGPQRSFRSLARLCISAVGVVLVLVVVSVSVTEELGPQGIAPPASPAPAVPRPEGRAPAGLGADGALREAGPDEIWITQPTIEGTFPKLPVRRPTAAAPVSDSTPPTTPSNLVAKTSGLFSISATWSPATDPETGIAYYAYAIGTGATDSTMADVRYWQSVGTNTRANVSLALAQGRTYYFTVRAINGANLWSDPLRSGPLTATARTYGQADNRISYAIAPTGYDANGQIVTWSISRVAEISNFLNRMFPVLYELYGPPSSSYTVTLVNNPRYTNSAIFFPSTDEIHMGGSASYQLITHEIVHAWRRDRILSGGNVWQYDSTLSGFEEGFAQAVSYHAMTEFARRYPDFGLSQKIYQSSNEWDYDFQNTPELRTTNFWSDDGGTLLYWTRYEMAAAALAKIEGQYPGFYRAFNAEFYRRISADPYLTSSRALIKDIIQTVAPEIEGKPASQWIDQQYIFSCALYPGKKVWLFTQHYPWTEYFIFNRSYFYETFSNGSDWAFWNGGEWTYYRSNGSQGVGMLRDSNGDIVWQRALLISPTDNPPAYLGFGSDRIDMTTQASNLPWPGGDANKFVTNLLSLGLYRLTIQFSTAGATVTNNFYRVIGQQLRDTQGVFGGIIGADGGQIYLNHRNYPSGPPISVVNGAFWAAPAWASLSHPQTRSVDTEPGVVDVTYIDSKGKIYTDSRVIGYGSASGSQAFLFDIAKMRAASQVDLAISKSHSGNFSVGANGTYTITVRNDGSAPSSEIITVTDVLPAGLGFVSAAGAGWTCSASGQIVTCTSAASVAAGTSAGSISLTVNVSGAGGTVINRASVSNLSDANPSNNSATDVTVVDSETAPAAPSLLSATSCFRPEVNVTWTDNSDNETGFVLERKLGTGGSYSQVATLAANVTRYLDRGLAPASTHYYRVRASSSAGSSAYSNEAAGTTNPVPVFSDDPLAAGVTEVRAVHLTELRQAVNAMRACAALPAAGWTDGALSGVFIRALHLQEIRNNLKSALAALGLPAPQYTEDPLPAGAVIRKVHLEELRNAVR